MGRYGKSMQNIIDNETLKAKSSEIHTKECTYRNNHDFRHDNCFCTCHPKNEKKKGNLKPELRKNMKETLS